MRMRLERSKRSKIKTVRHNPKRVRERGVIQGDGKEKRLKATEEGCQRGRRIKHMESQRTQQASLKKLQARAEAIGCIVVSVRKSDDDITSRDGRLM